MELKFAMDLLSDAKEAAVGECNYPLAASIRDLMDAHKPQMRGPCFTSISLGWVSGLASRFEQAICDLAIERSKRTDCADVTMEMMQDAARIVIESAPDYWDE